MLDNLTVASTDVELIAKGPPDVSVLVIAFGVQQACQSAPDYLAFLDIGEKARAP